jgi:lipopolysaccharide export system protein LptA
MVATGQIEIEQPGRRATGERLQYTANDRLFVLTGDDRVQPKMVDKVRGTITGAAILFHPGDDNVVVSNTEPGAASAAPDRRVRTETHAGKDATMRKGK